MEDIAGHLETLRSFAGQGDVTVEFGVRYADPTSSTIALLYGTRKELWSYEITPMREYTDIYDLAQQLGKVWYFHAKDSRRIKIPVCDFLFIDTEHTPEQADAEIRAHIEKVKRYIGFHDTHCSSYPDFGAAVFEIMARYPFHVVHDNEACNGLTIWEKDQ